MEVQRPSLQDLLLKFQRKLGEDESKAFGWAQKELSIWKC